MVKIANPLEIKYFNTYSNDDGADEFFSYIDSINDYHFIIIAVKFDMSTKMNENGLNALK